MAKLVEEKLSSLLKEAGVTKFKLSRRAKDPKSLREKLIIRSQGRKEAYKDFQEIKKDIVDLAGVRIILYMPTQEDNHKVKEVIQKEWGQDIVPRIHPPPQEDPKAQPPLWIEPGKDNEAAKRPKYRPLHLGYRAVHYRVPMREKQGGAYGRLEDDQVEIQVVSALTHAWAEVGHDILYKSLAEGRPSLEEERILDALNGLIQSGDLLLEQFQKMYIKRTSQPFKYREDLMRFLRNFLNPDEADSDLEPAQFPRGEGTYILFKFLQMENLNTPRQVLPELERLGYPFHHHAKEDRIRESFSPIPKFAPNMSLVICLTRHLLHEKPYNASSESKSVPIMFSIMMSALTLLDFCLGGPEEAKEYLQKLDMTEQQIENINFLLEGPLRYEILLGEMDQEKYKSEVQGPWEWFCNNASDPDSLCGFLFRLADMGCRKNLKPRTMLKKLQILPLSRSNTADLTCDTGSGADLAQPPEGAS
ncbi:hypothetical protein SLS60_009977 [Paraconiothyrium brasiliense]|uniref:RelA/SpoT domain-containing protein n=1 Tax=Paraconiothyrium brasiliense TaxID=300254 RepID=A0ABR3QU43_9PLEO